jgi:hypothetical protein
MVSREGEQNGAQDRQGDPGKYVVVPVAPAFNAHRKQDAEHDRQLAAAVDNEFDQPLQGGQRFGMSPDDVERLQLPDAVHFLARHQMRIDRPFNWGLIGSAA